MAKKICLISDLHLSVNPRLWKEAFVYEEMGYEVVILTQWVNDYFLQKDWELLKQHKVVYKSYLDMRPQAGHAIRRFFYRARRRLGGELRKRFGISTSWSVSYAPDLLLKAALSEKADVYSAHVEAGFLVGRKLIEAGCSVGFDMEDWYSRDYLVKERAVDLLHRAEGYALQHGVFFFTTSQAMARRLKAVWKSDRKVTIIYNSFPGSIPVMEQAGDRQNSPAFRILWTSRTIGPKRGLETLVEALKYVQQPVELHLIGKLTEGYEDQLRKGLGSSSKHTLIITEFLPHAELTARIAGFDLGLALEYNVPDNKDLTISNKILQYLQAGIMILCTDTQGQIEVANASSVTAFAVPVDHPEIWARQIEIAIQEKGRFDRARQQAAYQSLFSWEQQAIKIRETITRVCPLAEERMSQA